jgi:PhnB protein
MTFELPTVFTYICVDGAAAAIEFYKRAFGAQERCRLPVSEGGPLGHAELAIGNTVLFLADEYPQNNWLAPPHLAGTAASLVLAVDDCDAAFQRAIDAGATLERPITDGHDGRGGWLIDPYGHHWNVMTPGADFGAHRHD